MLNIAALCPYAGEVSVTLSNLRELQTHRCQVWRPSGAEETAYPARTVTVPGQQEVSTTPPLKDPSMWTCGLLE